MYFVLIPVHQNAFLRGTDCRHRRYPGLSLEDEQGSLGNPVRDRIVGWRCSGAWRRFEQLGSLQRAVQRNSLISNHARI